MGIFIQWWYFEDGWKKAQRLEELRHIVAEGEKNLHNELRDYLKDGDKMEAIKVYKDYYECSLSKAKTAISEIEWELKYEEHVRAREEAYIRLPEENSVEVHAREFNDKDNESAELSSKVVEVNKDDTVNANNNRPRTGMKILSVLCYGWSVICFLVLVGGLVARMNVLLMLGIGEGLFTLILGLMFSVLAKSEKRNPYVCLGKKNIKKFVFVILCVVIAYVCFLGTLGIMGGFVVAS